MLTELQEPPKKEVLRFPQQQTAPDLQLSFSPLKVMWFNQVSFILTISTLNPDLNPLLDFPLQSKEEQTIGSLFRSAWKKCYWSFQLSMQLVTVQQTTAQLRSQSLQQVAGITQRVKLRWAQKVDGRLQIPDGI